MRIFSHGLKFQPALQGEILLRLHGKFQPRFKHNFSIAAILRERERKREEGKGTLVTRKGNFCNDQRELL